MTSKQKNILNIFFFVSIFAITLYSIFHGQDMSEFMKNIQNADIRYWFIAVICVVFFIGSEAIIIFYMMHTIKQKVQLKNCFLYSFIGFFFSCITPSASGGQPAQIYYMRKDKISIPVSTLVLMIVTITYKMVLVVIGIAVVIIHPAEIMQYLRPVLGWCYLGLALNIISVCFMVILVFHPTMAQSILIIIVKASGKIHLLKRTDFYLEKIKHGMQQYQDVAVYFRTHRLVVWNVFLITVVQRLSLFYVTYLTYRSFGYNSMGITTIVILQGMISVAVDMLPLPGGMGISEKLFLVMFLPIFGKLTLPALVISRGLSYYAELIISALFTIVAHFVIGKEKERSNL